MNNKKEMVIKEIKQELENILNSLKTIKKDSKEYNVLIEKKEILEKELNIISNLNNNNMFDILNEGLIYKNKYNYLTTFNNQELGLLVNIIKKYQKEIKDMNDNNSLNINITEELKDFESEFIKQGVDTKHIDSLKYRNKVLEIFYEVLEKYNYALKRFKLLTKDFNINDYYNFKNDLKENSKFITSNSFKRLERIPEDALIRKIKELEEKREYEESKTILNRTRIKIHEEYQNKIVHYMNKLLINIKKYYLGMYKMYQEDLGLGISIDEKKELILTYQEIERSILKKNKDIANLEKSLKLSDSILTVLEKKFEIYLNNSNIKGLTEEDINILRSIKLNTIQEIIAKIKLYDRIMGQSYEPGSGNEPKL